MRQAIQYTTRAKWKTIKKYDTGVTLTTPTPKKIVLDLGLKVAGAAACYGLGLLAGDLIEQIPYLNQHIPQVIDYVSKIDVTGNIDGLVGLLGAIYGFSSSGTKTFEDDPDKLHKIELSPIALTIKKEKKNNSTFLRNYQ